MLYICTLKICNILSTLLQGFFQSSLAATGSTTCFRVFFFFFFGGGALSGFPAAFALACATVFSFRFSLRALKKDFCEKALAFTLRRHDCF